MPKSKEFPSELRHDLASGNWVIIAKGRAKKPKSFKTKRIQPDMKKEDCPFCNIETQLPPILTYTSKGKASAGKKIPKDWAFVVIPNKYPALMPSTVLNKKDEGELFQTLDAVGHCELIIGRDHEKNMPDFSIREIEALISVCQKRYLDLMQKPFVEYISIFQNYGVEAGASQPHPHLQIITTPLIDVDLIGSLANAERYFAEHKRCIYCRIIEWEIENKIRVVYENDHFIAICPFASKTAFQVIVSPKKHLSNFEEITDEEKVSLADAANAVARVLNKGLSDPAYNFYLHTSPCDGKDHSYYHWHWTVLPRTSSLAGFELGTHMEISTIEPETAAEYLRGYL